MLTEFEQQELTALAQRLIQTPSLTAQERGVAELIAATMHQLGYHEVHTDEWGNVIGVIRGSGTGSVLFDAHIDTVPFQSEGWSHHPLGGEIADGRIYGRGASDMKGAAAAAIYGVGRLAREGGDFGTIYVSCTVCEEPAEGPMLIKVCERFQPAAVVIMEATQLKVNVGQRGRAELIVESIGKPAHSSRPDLGVNAVKSMAKLIRVIDELKMPTDFLLGSALFEVTDLISTPYPGLSVVPYRCRATFDRRLLVEDTEESVIRQVEEMAESRGIQVSVRLAETEIGTYTGKRFTHKAFAPAWKTPADSKLVRQAQAALRTVGQEARLGAYSFCTNGSGSAGILGIPTIGYGPGREEEAHIVDEFLELSQLFGAAEGYSALARDLSR